MNLQLQHYGRKGIFAYLCKLSIQGNNVDRGVFVNGKPTEEDKEDFHRGKAVVVNFNLDDFEDGIYEVKEASGHKTRIFYVELSAGNIAKEWDSVQEVIEYLAPPAADLPDLEGTERQIEWAKSIRATALRGGLDLEVAKSYKRAKFWIDYRHTFKQFGVR